jgi:hypothetical protein
MKKHLRIGVLETSWNKKANHSVRPLFEVLSHINTENVDGFAYERFSSKRSFSDTISFLIGNRSVSYLYIAAHGNDQGICAGNGDSISRSEIRNDICAKATLHGLYLGSCEFGVSGNAEFLLEDSASGKTNPLKWIAGYNEEVDWVHSSALDFMFLHQLFWENEKKHQKYIDKISNVSNALVKKCSGLIRELGFHVYARKKGPTGGMKDLVAAAYESEKD